MGYVLMQHMHTYSIECILVGCMLGGARVLFYSTVLIRSRIDVWSLQYVYYVFFSRREDLLRTPAPVSTETHRVSLFSMLSLCLVD